MYNLGGKSIRTALKITAHLNAFCRESFPSTTENNRMSGFYEQPSYQGISFLNLSTAFAQLKIQQQLPKIMEQVDYPNHIHIWVRSWTYCSQREGTPTYFREGSSQPWYEVLVHKHFHWSAIMQEQQDMVELLVIQLFSILKE